ncbi:hypothetical protein [Aphanizomenon flos-aquae]|uniref:hypothetical protein n=1 Tax=Aphanizomenon flos-aquae TaxID=1176 RepID=UPI001688DC26|nr:hypothetical protein [Aphanizomenon flos-aquae]MBD2390593.1 hypothetical protein [Aphanizomenon flos-aquae FACHB-1171]
MKNLCRLALITGIAALSAVAFNPKAQAEIKDINFSGTIARICTFGANYRWCLSCWRRLG